MAWLFENAGLNAAAYSPVFLQRRLSACLRALRADSTQAAMQALTGSPDLVQKAVDAVLIGVSGFFRDQSVFDVLRTSVLTKLLEGKRGLRVCSIGCSEGQELYSIAMLLEELHALQHSQLLGVDCRPEALARAREGSFDPAELINVPAEFQSRYFSARGSGRQIAPQLRARAQWRQGNCLGWDYSDGAWDLFLFRNVAIYLNRQEMDTLWPLVARGLKPGGVLVTGKAEQPAKSLPLKKLSRCIYMWAPSETTL